MSKVMCDAKFSLLGFVGSYTHEEIELRWAGGFITNIT